MLRNTKKLNTNTNLIKTLIYAGVVTRKKSRMQLLKPPPFTFGATPVVVFRMSKIPEDGDLKLLQDKFKSAAWTAIQGCQNDRWYIPIMSSSFKRVAELVTGNVTDMIRHLHPKHTYIHYSALKSAANNSQQDFHTDYDVSVVANSENHERPFSVIITFNDPCFFVYNESNAVQKNIVTLTVPPFSFVRFMGDVEHCGGANTLNYPVYRLFMYFAALPSHLPTNSFNRVEKAT